jgi:hypothetical protein
MTRTKLAENLIMKSIFSLLLVLLLSNLMQAGDNTQVIRGTITDQFTMAPIEGATIVILNAGANLGARSDQKGHYEITGVNPGRYEVKITCVGYRDIQIPNIVVSSGKETILDIGLDEQLRQLKGAKVKANNKSRAVNELATISARTFSMEEVNRYAGGRSDPARLASNFAGVSTPDDSRNDIVIRGNSPTGVLWRLEGMNMPNPNHFATVGTTGGPVSALNTNMLRNSDFMTSAFPAEYGNANAGVFDIGFRKGNTQKREHTIQFGMLTGLEAMTEGPIKKGSDASYLVAYRYSFTGIAQAMGLNIGTTATPFYQDLSFKIQSGDGKYGRFTLFGIGGLSNISFKHDNLDTTDLFADPTADSYFRSDIALMGLKHLYKFNQKTHLQTIIGGSYAASNFLQDSVRADESTGRVIENTTARKTYYINSILSSKINSRTYIKAGLQVDLMQLNLDYRVRLNLPDWKQVWDFDDMTTLVQGFVHARYLVNEQLSLNAGLHAQMLTLNQSFALEPRLSVKYALSPKSSLTFGYGMHSQMQPTDVYFYREQLSDGSYDQSNRELDFTRSQHLVLAYDLLPVSDWRIKTEIYYQFLNQVPVTQTPSSFSMLNTGSSFQPNNQGYLQNTGKGENYGVELTIEKFFSKGYYGLFTSSLYESKYTGSDLIQRNTAFNGNYVVNVLAGKEFKIGPAKQDRIFIDLKASMAGGRYYTPVDLDASRLKGEQVLEGDELAFSERNPNYFRTDIKMGYTRNSRKRKLSHSFYFDIQNVSNHKNVFAERYNPVNQSVNTAYQIGLFPNFMYRLQF